MPWKNGLGKTTEIATQPGGGDFLWRFSIADIIADGPFSAFPGVNRLLAVVAGEGMRLQVGLAAPVTMRRFDAPLRFEGKAPAHCALLGGPVRGANLMVARDHARGEMALLRGRLDRPLTLAPCGTALLLVLAGVASVTFRDQQAVAIAPGDAAQIHAPHASIRIADGAEAVLAIVEPIPSVPPPQPV